MKYLKRKHRNEIEFITCYMCTTEPRNRIESKTVWMEEMEQKKGLSELNDTIEHFILGI